VAARKDQEALGGGYGALSDERFAAGGVLLNASLVPVARLSGDAAAGYAVLGTGGLRASAASQAGPGVLERLELKEGTSLRPTRMVEAPVLAPTAGAVTGAVFTRTLAPLANGTVVALTASGFTVLPWNYDAAVGEPRIEQVVSAADGTAAVAPGGLVTVRGRELGLTNAASSEVPLPTALADSCLTVNGVLAPMVLVSPGEIHAQLPAQVLGGAVMVLRTPAGVSNSFRFEVRPLAPAVFHTGTAGPVTGVAAVLRAVNQELVTLSNPVHPEDTLVIYATGLGGTSPPVEDGYPGPAGPLAETLLKPEVTLGGVPLAVLYAGLAPGQVGVYQINARVPGKPPLGMEVPLVIAQGEASTTLPVRVVK
jgi:uncharacterized protein (TIGR03437 family)